MWPMPSVLTSPPTTTDAMEKELEEAEKWPVWINWDRRIVSFEEAEGFERLEYPSHDEMFQFAIDKTMDGFAIQ